MMQLTHNGKTLSAANWGRIQLLNPETIRARKKAGLTDSQALGFEADPRRKCTANLKKGQPLFAMRPTEPVETLKVATRMVEIIDSHTIGIEAKRIRRACGVTQEQAGKDFGLSTYNLLESSGKAWTAALVEKFNRVAAGWVVRSD